MDEIVFWLICAIAAAGVWWAFFGGAITRHRNEHTDYVGKGPGLLLRNQGLPRPCGPRRCSSAGRTLTSPTAARVPYSRGQTGAAEAVASRDGRLSRTDRLPNRNNSRAGGFHERYANMETSMLRRKIFALTLFAAIAVSSAALAQGGGGGGGGAGGGGAGGASGGAAGGASGAGGAAGTTGGATTGAPNTGTTTGSGVNSNATGQRPGGNTPNSRDNTNNQDRNPRR
jgi:hypothetical protein